MVNQIKSWGNNDGLSGCSEDYEGSDSHHGNKTKHRHTPEQIKRLEEFYKEWPHPDGDQQLQLGMELGLEPIKIKFWFQNKRTQIKVQNERSGYSSLRSDYDSLQYEYNSLRSKYDRVQFENNASREDNKKIIQKLQLENRELKHKCGRAINLLENIMGRPPSWLACNILEVGLVGNGNGKLNSEVDNLASNVNDDNHDLNNMMNPHPELEKMLMVQIVALNYHLRDDNPFWIECPTNGHYNLDCDSFEKFYDGLKKQRFQRSRMESSKYTDIVAMNLKSLVDLILDADKWVDSLPTIISKAEILRVLEAGLLETRSDSLQMIYQKMHILSPIIWPREYILLQHCQEIKIGIWVIVNVSYNKFEDSIHNYSSTYYWKHPSGWMIEELPNGFSKVTCIEHVEVDDDFQVHPIYEDLVKSTLGFGAKRWIMTLQRTCENFSYLSEVLKPANAITKGRRSMVMLSHRMMKKYCSTFSLFKNANIHQLPEIERNTVKINVIRNIVDDLPTGIIIYATSSFWVPASATKIFDYLCNNTTRSQWDVLCNGNPVNEIIHIPTRNHSGNAISILQPLNPNESNKMIFQEVITGQYESLIVYAPIDVQNMIELTNGMNSSNLPILASGFAITPNSLNGEDATISGTSSSCSGGSLITMALQMLPYNSFNTNDVSDKLSMATKMVNNVVHAIKCII